MLFYSVHVGSKVATAAVIEQINNHLKLNVIFVVFLSFSFLKNTVSKQQLAPTYYFELFSLVLLSLKTNLGRKL